MTARELAEHVVTLILWLSLAGIIVSYIRDRIRHAREWRKFTHREHSR